MTLITVIKIISDAVGSFIGALIVASAFMGIWTFTRKRVAENDSSAAPLLSPSVPVLQMSSFVRSRRFSLWFLALFFQTVNALLYAIKMEGDHWCMLMKGTSLGITLICCIAILILLDQSFHITKDFWISGAIFGLVYMVAVTVTLTKVSSWCDTVLGLIHILITIFMSILRFSCQEGFLQFEKWPFIVAFLGFIGGCLPFISWVVLSSEISLYQVATIIGGIFRLLDAIFIMGVAPRDKINQFLVRLQDFLT